MSAVDAITALLWHGGQDEYLQAIELLAQLPELIRPTSIAAAAIQDLSQLCFLEEAGAEYPRGLSDALSLRAAERIIDRMSDAERAVLYPLLTRIRAAHCGTERAEDAVQHGYRIAHANRGHNGVRLIVRLLLITLEPLAERWEPWWQMPHAFANAMPDIAARQAWEQAWEQTTRDGHLRSQVRAAARQARDQAREQSGPQELDAAARDTWMLAPPIIRAMLTEQVLILR